MAVQSICTHGLVYSKDKWPYTKLISLTSFTTPKILHSTAFENTHKFEQHFCFVSTSSLYFSFLFLIEVMGMKRSFFYCFCTDHLLFFPPHRLHNPVPDGTIRGCGDAANRQRWVSKVHINIPLAHSFQSFDFSLTQRCGPTVMSGPRLELLLSLGVSRFLTFYGC